MIYINGVFEKEILSTYKKDGQERIKRVFAIKSESGWVDYVQVKEELKIPKVGEEITIPLAITGFVGKQKAKIFYREVVVVKK